MTFEVDYYSSRKYWTDRKDIMAKHTFYTYKDNGDIAKDKYNAPNCYINVEGHYIRDIDITETLPYSQRQKYSEYLYELRRPNNNYLTPVRFRFRRKS